MSNVKDFVIENGVLLKYEGGARDVVIPDGVTAIGFSAFSYQRFLESVVIPEGVTNVALYAFMGCDRLSAVTLPHTLTQIGYGAFSFCSSLTEIVIPDSVTVLESCAFSSCTKLKTVQMSRNLTAMHANAFSRCSSLQAISLPDTLTVMGDGAFSGCSNLAAVRLPATITAIGNETFSYCEKLQTITIPDGVTSIGDKAFASCYDLSSVHIPEGVTTIGERAFHSCSQLVSVTLPDTVTELGEAVFTNCRRLREVTLSRGLTALHGYVFADCRALTALTIPEGVTAIQEGAFKRCSTLTEVVLPESLKVIGDNAFEDCKRLEELMLPDSVISVGTAAFLGCDHLARLGIPADLSIGLWYGDGGTEDWCDCVARMHRLATDAALKKYVLERVWDTLADWFQAEIFMAHQSKGMLEAYRKCVKDAATLGRQILAQLPEEISAKEATMVANYIQLFASKENTVIRALYHRLKGQKKAAKALAKLEEDGFLMTLLQEGADQPLSPIEAALNAALEARGVTRSELPALVKAYYSLTESDLPALLDAEGKKAPALVLMYLLIAHETDKYRDVCAAYVNPGVCPEAAALVALLDGDSLQQALVTIGDRNLGMTGRSKKMFLAYPICRYGDEDTMRQLTAIAPKWRSSVSGIDAPPLLTFRRANRYSNTRAAMLFADKYKELIEYARLRGTDADTIRDVYLSDVGLDAQGRKEYDLGNQTVTVELQKDLSLIVLLPGGKTAKTLPKKGADEALFAAANDHFSEMRKSVKRIVKNRKDLLFDEFLIGKKRTAASWQEAYLKNPVLRSVAELLVWAQGKAAFTVAGGGLIAADGSAYTLTDAPIAVAHPVEITPASVAAWQAYFLRHGLKQPFEQVWEPVVDWSAVKSDRYAGCRIPYYRFVGQAKRGITVEDCDFHNEIYITIEGFHAMVERLDWERHHIDMNHCFEIKSFLPGKQTRLSNHLIAYFDRCTVYERILKNDVTIATFLPSFTAAQIAEFIKAASEHGCTEVTAILLNYQQAHFADLDPMAEFTLD